MFNTVHSDVQRADNIDKRYYSISICDGKTQLENIQIFVDGHVSLYVFQCLQASKQAYFCSCSDVGHSLHRTLVTRKYQRKRLTIIFH